MEKSKQLNGLDYFKVAAALLVVAIHTSPLASYNEIADFVLTRVIARVAVPFFFMVTGYFVLPQYLLNQSKDLRPLIKFIKHTLILYAAAITLYLPVNFYAGQFKGLGISDILRMFIFDGTFYHLWYLPASVMGIFFVYLLSRKLSLKTLAGIALALYCFGLFGDSYFGFIENAPAIRAVYDTVFQISSYTRNGIFYAPIFLVLGACMRHVRRRRKNGMIAVGFSISMVLMTVEGLTLHFFGLQRHDSMYLALLPCMLFLFQLLLSVKKPQKKSIREISKWIYLIHPLMIVAVRGVAKVFQIENIMIDNSFLHYTIVSILSFDFAILVEKLRELKCKKEKGEFLKGRAWIELNRTNLHQNITALRKLLPPDCQLMPAVKADAYGHGAVLISKELNACGIRSFCVATVSEGVMLRCGGIKGEILVLGYTHPEQFSLLRKYRLMQTVVDYEYAQVLNVYGRKIEVHIKIDTGMHRLGERCEDIDEICRIFQLKNLLVRGMYTHLCADESTSSSDRAFTVEQGKAFYKVVTQLKECGLACPKIHLLSSYGLLNYPQMLGDYARIGIALYGVLSRRNDMEHSLIRFCPVLSVKARVVLVKDLYKGESAGYGLQYVAECNKKIAVLSIGYADGIPRQLSYGIGQVLINGAPAPIIGRICMDQTLVDVTEIPDIQQGDIAVILGISGEYEITAYDIAEQAGTITNEVLSRMGSRLNRMMV